MRAVATGLVTAALLGLALIALAPATLIASQVNAASGGFVQLLDAEGAWWRGRGTLAIGDGRLPLAWSVGNAEALRGRLTLHVRPLDAAASVLPAVLTASSDGIVLTGVDLQVPVRAIAASFITAPGVALGGDAALEIKQLEYRGGAWKGQATIVWRRARAVIPSARPALTLGDVTAALTGAGERMAGPLANSGGEATIRGEVALGQRPRLTLSVLVTPRRADDDDLARLLAAIGKAESGGWRIDWQAGAR